MKSAFPDRYCQCVHFFLKFKTIFVRRVKSTIKRQEDEKHTVEILHKNEAKCNQILNF